MTLYEALSEPGSVRGLPGVFQGSSRGLPGSSRGSGTGPSLAVAQNGGPPQLAPRRLILTTAQPSVGERYLRDLFMVVDHERRGCTHYCVERNSLTDASMGFEDRI